VVLGSRDTLKEIVVSLQQEFMEFEKNPNVWQGVEACLYCIRSIARRVEHGESNVIPAVMELMPRFTQNPYLRYTATLIIGRYSDWINQHPNTLPGLLQFVVGGLNEPMVTFYALCCLLFAICRLLFALLSSAVCSLLSTLSYLLSSLSYTVFSSLYHTPFFSPTCSLT
jgi:transportin-3